MKLTNWKFWKTDNEQRSSQRSPKLPKPKDLPDRVGIHLVTQLKLDPDWVWSLKVALRPTPDRHIFDIRIFDPKEAVISDMVVRDFNSLDDYPEMVLFKGSFNRETGWIDIKRTTDKAA